MHINHLPDDCLILILNRHLDLSLTELIRLRSVCSHWHRIIATICRSKRSLKLFGSVYNFLWYYSTIAKLLEQDHVPRSRDRFKDVIQFRGTSVEAADFLPALFPNLKSLFFYCSATQLKLGQLLEQWPNSLEQLTLWGDPPNEDEFESLWVGVHSQHGSLQELYLMDMEWLDIPEGCDIINRLQVLGIKGHHGYQSDALFTRLSPRCHSLLLEQARFTPEVSVHNLMTADQVRHLTHLTIDAVDECATKRKAKQLLGSICATFVQLKYFYPKFASEIQLDEIQMELAHLPKLAHLRLYTNCVKLGVLASSTVAGHFLPSSNYAQFNRLAQFPSHKPLTRLRSLVIENYQFQVFLFKRRKLELLEFPFESPNARGLFRKQLLDRLRRKEDFREQFPLIESYRVLHDDSIVD